MIDPHKVFTDFFATKDRVVKAFIYQTSLGLNKGNICTTKDDIKSNIDNPYKSEADDIEYSIEENDLVAFDGEHKKPFVFLNGKFYLQKYFTYESNVLEDLYKRSSKNNFSSFNLDKWQKNKNDQQAVAVALAQTGTLTIITGGPGTGKTTTVAKLLLSKLQSEPNLKIALLAPTGKAVIRLAESLRNAQKNLNLTQEMDDLFDCISIKTIHSFLKKKVGYHPLELDEARVVEEELIVVDESSMVDLELMNDLLSTIPDSTSLILLGDKNQLSSVGAGSVFGDLCSSLQEPNSFSDSFLSKIKSPENEYSLPKANFLQDRIVELTKSHRFNAQDDIGQTSLAILKGETNIIDQLVEDKKVQVKLINEEKYFSVIDSFVDKMSIYTSKKTPKEALEVLNQYKILCATNESIIGVNGLNNYIQERLASLNKIKVSKHSPFYHNQPIMVTKNLYEFDIFNGDIGIVRETEQGDLNVYFEDGNLGIKELPVLALSHFDLSFCMTIHKSQGSEFANVLLAFPNNEIEFYTRELIYTGITRAKKSAIILGDVDCLKNMISKSVKRVSGIKERIYNYGV